MKIKMSKFQNSNKITFETKSSIQHNNAILKKY